MAPINFDDNIKKKLEERTIKPSANAWDALADKLDAKEKTSNKKLFWWFGIAATLVGVFLAITMLFNDEKSIEPAIVDSPKEEKQELKKPVIDNQVLDDNFTPVLVENNVKSEVKNNKKDSKPPTKTNQLKQTYLANNQSEEIKNTNRLNSTVASQIQEANQKEIIEEEVVVSNEKESKNLDSEVDKLLQDAQQDLALKSQINNQRTVDANSLLESVEDNMEETFKVRILKTLKSSYITVKTAVAQRND